MERKLSIVPPYAIPAIWKVVAPLIDRGYGEADEIMPDDILQRLFDGHMALWIIADEANKIVAAMNTELVRMRSGLACRMIACGGEDVRSWAHTHEAILQYARGQGCAKVILGGRRGWAKILPGFHQTLVTLERNL